MEYAKNLHILDELNASADILSEQAQIKNQKKFERLIWWKSFWKTGNVFSNVKTFFDFKVNLLYVASDIYSEVNIYQVRKMMADGRDLAPSFQDVVDGTAAELYADRKVRDNGLSLDIFRECGVWRFYRDLYLLCRFLVRVKLGFNISDKYIKLAQKEVAPF